MIKANSEIANYSMNHSHYDLSLWQTGRQIRCSPNKALETKALCPPNTRGGNIGFLWVQSLPFWSYSQSYCRNVRSLSMTSSFAVLFMAFKASLSLCILININYLFCRPSLFITICPYEWTDIS